VHQMRSDSMQPPARYLKKDRMNIVIIPSSNETFVNYVTTQLNTASNNFQINLYGLASWTKFVNLDLEYLHALEFRYATPFYIDHDRPAVKNFLRQFNRMYHTEPANTPLAYRFGYLGYDVTFFFASAMMMYGKDFGQCLTNYRMPKLQSDFRFERIDPYSGYIHKYPDIYKYGKDYSITKE